MHTASVRSIPGIGVDLVGDAADALADAETLRLENLDTDIEWPAVARAATRAAIDDDAANSYLPFPGHLGLRRAAAAWVGSLDGRAYDPVKECVITAGGLNGIVNALFATIEPGREVVIADPIYAGLVNRILLAGGVPRFVAAEPTPRGWQTDPEALAAAVGPQTAAVITMSPAMPTGAVLDERHWDALAGPVEQHRCWVIHDAAMERLRFDGVAPASPAAHPVLGARTITVGAASKELRMIGWRVGWVVGPAPILADIAVVSMANVVCPVGITQPAVAAALSAPDAEADVAAAAAILADRCATVMRELADYPCIAPHGGWSLLVDTAEMGVEPGEASRRLLELANVAATPMNGWGPSGSRYLRLVFSNEPTERLEGLGDRFRRALG